MVEFLLIRHAVNDYVKTHRLAGWTPGVHLNEEGKAQAIALGESLYRTRPMMPNACRQIGCDAHVKDAMWPIGHDVNPP